MADVIVRHGIGIIVLVYLSHTLNPSDFGLMAMLAIFVAVGTLFIDSGFSQALIQRQTTTIEDESTIFYFNVAVAALIALLLSYSAHWIAVYYKQPLLEQLTYWMALNLFISSFGAIHTTLLTKSLEFKTITKSGVLSASVSGLVAIVFAMQGFGVWSLIGQVISATLISVVSLWKLNNWRPKYIFSTASLKSYFHFGGFILWTDLLNALHSNIYYLLIGKYYSVKDVGFYSQALRLQQLPVSIMTNVIGRVAFPLFSMASGDKPRLARGLKKALCYVMFINVPLMLWLMLTAESFVCILLGPQWLPSVPLLRIFAIVGLMWPLHALNLNVLAAQGHSRLTARIQIIKISIALSLLLLASPYGIIFIAYGQVLSSILSFYVNAFYTDKFLSYGGTKQLIDIVPYIIASIPFVLFLYSVNHVIDMPALYRLAASVIIGPILYLITCWIAKLDAFMHFLHLLQRRKMTVQ